MEAKIDLKQYYSFVIIFLVGVIAPLVFLPNLAGAQTAGTGVPPAAQRADRLQLPALRPRARAARRGARFGRHLHRVRDRRPGRRQPADPRPDVGDRRAARGAGRRLVPAEAQRRQRRAAARRRRRAAGHGRDPGRGQRRLERPWRSAWHRSCGDRVCNK